MKFDSQRNLTASISCSPPPHYSNILCHLSMSQKSYSAINVTERIIQLSIKLIPWINYFTRYVHTSFAQNPSDTLRLPWYMVQHGYLLSLEPAHKIMYIYFGYGWVIGMLKSYRLFTNAQHLGSIEELLQ